MTKSRVKYILLENSSIMLPSVVPDSMHYAHDYD